jgi:hypothetical protein
MRHKEDSMAKYNNTKVRVDGRLDIHQGRMA